MYYPTTTVALLSLLSLTSTVVSTPTSNHRAPAVPTPVYCTVSYGRSKTNQRYVANCCTNSGAKAANYPSKKYEKCSGFVLPGQKINHFVGCVQKRKLEAKCYPVNKPAPVPQSTVVAAKPQSTVVAAPKVQTTSAAPVVVAPESRPTSSSVVASVVSSAEIPVATDSLPPVNNDSTCTASFGDSDALLASVSTCCKNAGGSVGASSTTSVNCQALDATNGELTRFTDCVGDSALVYCAL